MREQKKRVDIFDFSGEFEQLENIDIDARRKKLVEFYLTGNYPLLEKINYEGSFGEFTGEITGSFPKLALINFLCTSCAMDFDLRGRWERDCEINIRGMKEDVTLKLPKECNLIIYTKTAVRGKVIAQEMKKKGWFGILNKKYIRQTDSPITLTIHVETSDGNIILN